MKENFKKDCMNKEKDRRKIKIASDSGCNGK